MDFFQINYNKLENIKEIKFYIFIICLISVLLLLIIISFNIQIYKRFQCYGIYEDNILSLNINYELSDKINKSEYIIFKNKKLNFEIIKYSDYELLNEGIYQNVQITIDENFNNNEIGLIEFYYDKKTILKYIFDLFK